MLPELSSARDSSSDVLRSVFTTLLTNPKMANSTTFPIEALKHVLFARPRLFSFKAHSITSLRHPNVSQNYSLIKMPLNVRECWALVSSLHTEHVLNLPLIKARREVIRTSSEIQSLLTNLWYRMVPGDLKCTGLLSKGSFLYLEMRLRNLLCGVGEFTLAPNAVANDFALFSSNTKSSSGMTFSSFVNSMLTVADNWTMSTEVDEYIIFLRGVIMCCFSHLSGVGLKVLRSLTSRTDAPSRGSYLLDEDAGDETDGKFQVENDAFIALASAKTLAGGNQDMFSEGEVSQSALANGTYLQEHLPRLRTARDSAHDLENLKQLESAAHVFSNQDRNARHRRSGANRNVSGIAASSANRSATQHKRKMSPDNLHYLLPTRVDSRVLNRYPSQKNLNTDGDSLKQSLIENHEAFDGPDIVQSNLHLRHPQRSQDKYDSVHPTRGDSIYPEPMPNTQRMYEKKNNDNSMSKYHAGFRRRSSPDDPDQHEYRKYTPRVDFEGACFSMGNNSRDSRNVDGHIPPSHGCGNRDQWRTDDDANVAIITDATIIQPNQFSKKREGKSEKDGITYCVPRYKPVVPSPLFRPLAPVKMRKKDVEAHLLACHCTPVSCNTSPVIKSQTTALDTHPCPMPFQTFPLSKKRNPCCHPLHSQPLNPPEDVSKLCHVIQEWKSTMRRKSHFKPPKVAPDLFSKSNRVLRTPDREALA